MDEIGGHLDLTEEPLGAHSLGQIRAQDFYSHLPAMLAVFRKIDRGHSPTADLLQDAVAVRKRGHNPAGSVPGHSSLVGHEEDVGDD